MRLRRVDASSIHTCCDLIQCMREKTAEDNAPKLEAAAERHKQTIDTKMPEEGEAVRGGQVFCGQNKHCQLSLSESH